MPHPTSVHVSRVSPQPKEFAARRAAGGRAIRRPTLAQYPTVNGYSGQGDVTAEVVYVNYGLIEDYAQLDSMGVSVKGKIAIARYGRSFRGIKAREAEKHGAVGSADLQRSAGRRLRRRRRVSRRTDAEQRRACSAAASSTSDGDPSTPGYGSTADVPRLSPDKMEIPHIPVVPIGYGNAGELLKYVRGSRSAARMAGRTRLSTTTSGQDRCARASR